jgi:hypothetical protein
MEIGSFYGQLDSRQMIAREYGILSHVYWLQQQLMRRNLFDRLAALCFFRSLKIAMFLWRYRKMHMEANQFNEHIWKRIILIEWSLSLPRAYSINAQTDELS